MHIDFNYSSPGRFGKKANNYKSYALSVSCSNKNYDLAPHYLITEYNWFQHCGQ